MNQLSTPAPAPALAMVPLADACEWYLGDAESHAREASCRLASLSAEPGLAAGQVRRLQQLAALAALAAEGAAELLGELI